jgi:DNA-binding CsgD family transcriptional regulator
MAGCEYTKFITKLTRRELEVIEAVLAGALRYKSIASSLNISVNTVKTHLKKIYLTVGVNNIEALASLFHGYSTSKADITPKSLRKNKKSPKMGDKNQQFFAVIFYNILHAGGKKMQNFKALRIRTGAAISLVLVIALVIGFTATILVSGSRQTNMNFDFNRLCQGC